MIWEIKLCNFLVYIFDGICYEGEGLDVEYMDEWIVCLVIDSMVDVVVVLCMCDDDFCVCLGLLIGWRRYWEIFELRLV